MKNLYLPEPVKIIDMETLSFNVKRFRLQKLKGSFKKGPRGLVFVPGQFFLVGDWGYGEAPFGGASYPANEQYIDFAIRRVGMLTTALHQKKIGDEITLRGPYGHGFPLEFIENKDIVLVTGGCGIPPIASLVEYIIKNKEKFGRVYLLYGAATPDDVLLKKELKKWKHQGIKVILTVDMPNSKWKGHVGLVTELVEEININPMNAVATMCGPGPMLNALEKVLRPLGISDRRIFVSEERKMACGIGKCQHCLTGEKYVCLDGPVFYYDQIDKNWD